MSVSCVEGNRNYFGQVLTAQGYTDLFFTVCFILNAV